MVFSAARPPTLAASKGITETVVCPGRYLGFLWLCCLCLFSVFTGSGWSFLGGEKWCGILVYVAFSVVHCLVVIIVDG